MRITSLRLWGGPVAAMLAGLTLMRTGRYDTVQAFVPPAPRVRRSTGDSAWATA